jgi:hypothetical protein
MQATSNHRKNSSLPSLVPLLRIAAVSKAVRNSVTVNLFGSIDGIFHKHPDIAIPYILRSALLFRASFEFSLNRPHM